MSLEDDRKLATETIKSIDDLLSCLNELKEKFPESYERTFDNENTRELIKGTNAIKEGLNKFIESEK